MSRRNLVGLGLASATALSLLSAPLHASTWSDTYIGYRYGESYREPFNQYDITKNIISLTHASGYKYGSNFFNVDILSSNSEDHANCYGPLPFAGCNNAGSTANGGAQEVFVVYRTTLSGSAVTGLKISVPHVIRDVGLTGGFDMNAKNDQFSARVHRFFIGPKVSFDVPGYFDVAILYRKEHNHDYYATNAAYCTPGYTCTGDVDFKGTAQLEMDWGIPFKLGLPMKFQGFLTYTGAKGVDGTGVGTKPEILTEPALMADVGSLFKQKDTFWLGFQYQYWYHKFGVAYDFGAGGYAARVPQLSVEWHF